MYQMPKRQRQPTHNDRQHNDRQNKKQKLRNILKEGKRLRNTLERYKEQKLWFEERMPDATKEFLKISVPMSPEEAKLLEILEIRALLEGPRTIKQQEMLDTAIYKFQEMQEEEDKEDDLRFLDRLRGSHRVPNINTNTTTTNLHLRF